MKPLPIRLRLTLWYGAMFAAAAILLSVSSWWMLRRSLMATEYHELQERAEDVQLLLQQLGPNAGLDSLRQKFIEVYAVKDDGKYLQVLDDEGNWIYRSRRMLAESLQLAAPRNLPSHGTIVEFHQGTRYVRVLAYPIRADGRPYSVQTGIALNKSMVLLEAFTRQLLFLTPAVLILALIGGHFMSRKALAPVAAIATEARRINDRSLDVRLPVAASQDEISHLSETLNQMLERVESGVHSIREFTANAAHELRTPLALIRTEVEVALSASRSAEEYREACEQVQSETVRMTSLIDGLLMLARVDAGTEALRFETIDANQFARRVADTWKTSMRLALLNFHVRTESAPLFISADRNSLQRLLMILLDNAVRYTPPGGSVALQVAREGGRAVFAVHDTGIGISPEHHAKIFDRFYRVDRTRDASGGSGLGLALAKWIAEKHGASILLESAVEKGSTFSFSIRAALKSDHQRSSSERLSRLESIDRTGA
jgi:heavy metal sensor kinase